MTVSEYEVQFNSGVLRTIMNQKEAEEFVDVELKKIAYYNLWFRPVILFSNQCRQEGRTTT